MASRVQITNVLQTLMSIRANDNETVGSVSMHNGSTYGCQVGCSKSSHVLLANFSSALANMFKCPSGFWLKVGFSSQEGGKGGREEV